MNYGNFSASRARNRVHFSQEFNQYFQIGRFFKYDKWSQQDYLKINNLNIFQDFKISGLPLFHTFKIAKQNRPLEG